MTKPSQIYATLKNDIKIVEYQEIHAQSLANMWNVSSAFWGGDTTVHTEDNVKAKIERSVHLNAYVALTSASGEKE